MYSKDNAIVDRREMLRVKLASLVAEARIIRRQEQRTFGVLRNELAVHRRGTVRAAARETGLALGFIKGRKWEDMEPQYHTTPNWKAVETMVKKYGPTGFDFAAATKNRSN